MNQIDDGIERALNIISGKNGGISVLLVNVAFCICADFSVYVTVIAEDDK
jgi:hypothetical protein